ncbi:hypothetical protein [Novosphingobium sp. JCM 18896]|uniref:hypothetical protein n=1 Tax=Novosphingobium sp. JCM 18896 TaxID=2989731 RepID=UPI0022227C44|nr:hypothetical protein [Novosphingobium sp. JCM 18896]MCW1431575.1 hypothetical protein [Novosphingobium sp. JCM 18896]
MTKSGDDEAAKPSWPRKLWDAFANFAATDVGDAAYVADRVAEVEARLLEMERQFGLSALDADDDARAARPAPILDRHENRPRNNAACQ